MIILLAILLKLLLIGSPTTTDAALLSTTDSSQSPVQAIRFKMPKWVLAGADRLRLVCDYDLLGQTMHVMKLFKDNKEFYRYTPDERKLAFPVPGIYVDVDRSNGREVWLRRLDRRSQGEYRCEVSVEETFRSMSMARNLEVRSSPPATPTAAPPIDSSSPRQHSRQQPTSGPWSLLKSASKNDPEQQQPASAAPATKEVNLLVWLMATLLLLQVCL